MSHSRTFFATTWRLIRNHWFLMSTIILMFIVNGVHMIVTKRNIGGRGGGASAGPESDSLYVGALFIVIGLGFIAFKWFVCFLELKEIEMERRKV